MSGSAAGVVTTSTGPARRASASSSGVVSTTSPRNAVWMTRLVNLEDREERFLRDLDRSHLLHPLLALPLLLQELAGGQEADEAGGNGRDPAGSVPRGPPG